MSRRSNLRVSEDDASHSKRLTNPLLFPKNSSYDSLSAFMDDGDTTQDIESSKRPDNNSPEQGVPYFYQGGNPGLCQRILDVDGKTWESFKSRSLGRVESCEFSSIQQVDVKFDRLLTAPTYSDRSTRLPQNNNDNSEPQKHTSIFGLPVLSPFSALANWWLAIIAVVDLTFTAFFVPLLTAFVAREHSTSTMLLVVDFVSGVVFLFDIFVKFHIGFLVRFMYHRKVEMRGEHIVWYYFKHGGAWIDIISVLPSLLGLSAALFSSDESILHPFRYIRMIRIIRILRALKTVNQLLSVDSALSKYISSQLVCLVGVIYALGMLVNFLGCLLYFMAAAQHSNLEETWISSYLSDDSEPPDETDGYYYVLSVYWAITTLTTVGFGDVTPSTVTEMIIMGLIMVTQIVVFGFLIAAVTDVVGDSVKTFRNSDSLKEKLSEVRQWLLRYDLPEHIVQSVKDYYSQIWVRKQEVDEQLLLNEIPKGLRCNLVFLVTGDLMSKLPLFQLLKRETLFKLAARMDPLTKYPAEDITHHGHDSDSLFILEDGIVKLGCQRQSSAHRSAPDVFGISSLLPLPSESKEAFNWRLKAYSCCRIWKLKAEDLWEVVERVEGDNSSIIKGIHCHLKDRALGLEDDEAALQRMFRIELGRNISATKALTLMEKILQAQIELEDLAADEKAPVQDIQVESEHIFDGSSHIEIGSSEDAGAGEVWQKLIAALRQKGCHGAVEFLSNVRSLGYPSIAEPLFSSLVESYIDDSKGLDVHSFIGRSGTKVIDVQTIADKLNCFYNFTSRVEAVVEVFRSIIERVEDNKQGLDLTTLIQFYHPGNHPDVIQGLRSKSSVLSDLVNSFKHNDSITQEDFVAFHKNVSLCLKDDEEFQNYLQSMWLFHADH